MAKKKRKKRSKVGRPRGKKTGLSAASLADLQAEIDRRASILQDLSNRRQELAAELDELDREIARHGDESRRRGPGRPAGRRGPGRPPLARTKTTRRSAGRRPRNEMNLVDSLQGVLKGRTMGVSEVADAVQKAGYRTTSENFRTIVNQALITNPKIFRKVSRGKYTAK